MQTVDVVEGYFTCPTAFAIATDGLSDLYHARVRGQDFTIELPTVSTNDLRGRADLEAPYWHYRGVEIPQASNDSLEAFWGNGAIFNADNRPLAVLVKRFRIAMVNIVGDAAKQQAANVVARGIQRWWSLAATWIEVLHRQDLSRLGPVAPGVHFDGTTLWAQMEADAQQSRVSYVGAQPGRYSMPHYAPVSGDDFQFCLDLASNDVQPADAWLFIRDARSLRSGHDYRRAVLDAGVAAEVALNTLIRTHLTSEGLDESGVEKVLKARPYRTLRGRCTCWDKRCGGTLPIGYDERLVKTRDAATHEGRAVSKSQADDAITVAESIVEQAHHLPSPAE